MLGLYLNHVIVKGPLAIHILAVNLSGSDIAYIKPQQYMNARTAYHLLNGDTGHCTQISFCSRLVLFTVEQAHRWRDPATKGYIVNAVSAYSVIFVIFLKQLRRFLCSMSNWLHVSDVMWRRRYQSTMIHYWHLFRCKFTKITQAMLANIINRYNILKYFQYIYHGAMS